MKRVTFILLSGCIYCNFETIGEHDTDRADRGQGLKCEELHRVLELTVRTRNKK